jgi:integrase
MAKGKRHGLYQRRAGIWAFRYHTADGWKEKYTSTTSLAEARQFKDEFEQNLKDGALPTEKADWTIAAAAALWVQQHSARLRSQKGRSNERSLLRQLVRRIGSRRLGSVSLDVIKNYQAARLEEVGPRIVNLELRILTSVLKQENLWAAIARHYKPLKEQPSEIGRALSIAELNRLENVAASRPEWEVAYQCEVLAANTGMRGGEIKRLELRDVDLERRRLNIRKAKSDAGWRLVELNQSATAAVARLYQRAQLLGASEPGHYLLPTDLTRHTKATDPLKGGRGFDVRHHQNSWASAWRKLRKAAGLDGLRFHDLRHSFITLMAERNVPLPVVQSMVGHMSAAVTERYTHISGQAQRQAVELLDRDAFVGKFVGKAENSKTELPN